MKINRSDFLSKLSSRGFKSGSEFKVFKGEKEIGIIAVVRSTIVYIEIPEIPSDLLTNDEYSFEMLEVE